MAERPTHHVQQPPTHAVRTRPVIRVVVALVVLALLATACRAGGDTTIERSADRVVLDESASSSGDDDGDAGAFGDAEPDSAAAEADAAPAIEDPADTAPTDPPSGLPRALTASSIDCQAPEAGSGVALSDQGQGMYAQHVATTSAIPSYALAVDIDPLTGAVTGAMRAVVPAQERTLNFRVFAGMDAFDAGLVINNVTVDGDSVDARLDRALLSLPAPSTTADTNTIELDFSFTIDQMAANDDIFGALTGESLQPDQVGLLGRTDTGMQLGHWFPVWLPDGIRTDPDPSGFGDIGAFPAANICTTITVPPGYQVVTGGTRTDTTDTSIVEAGAGLRDFSILISNDLITTGGFVRGVEIRVWGPSGNPDALITVLDHAEKSLDVLTEAFGPYPWKEVDIISAPLGAGVGGMEWPGAIWIEQSMFAGGLPGFGDLSGLFDDDEMGAIFESVGGAALTTSLEWTVAHELGHEWWHATVGNDSIESPAVDEPLAQFSACLAMERIHPDNWRMICDAQTIDQYAQARSLGVPDTAAEQASDQFESSIQYGAVVYGKAPGFYYAAADLLGWDALVASLRSFVADNAFALVSTNTLRAHLIEDAGDQGEQIGELWDRWFREARGDEDIAASELPGGLQGLEGLEDLDLTELFGEDFDIESFFGDDFDLEGLFGEDFDLESLLGENANIDDLLQ